MVILIAVVIRQVKVGKYESNARTNWRIFLPVILAKINSTKANIFGGILTIKV
jgi:hypothetical protein